MEMEREQPREPPHLRFGSSGGARQCQCRYASQHVLGWTALGAPTPPECFAARYQFRGSHYTSRRDTTRPNGIDETIQQRAAALIKAAMHGQPQEVKLLLKSFQHPSGANKG